MLSACLCYTLEHNISGMREFLLIPHKCPWTDELILILVVKGSP